MISIYASNEKDLAKVMNHFRPLTVHVISIYASNEKDLAKVMNHFRPCM